MFFSTRIGSKALTRLALSAALVAVSFNAQAGSIGPPGEGPVDLTQWGTSASTDTADCPSFCTNFGAGGSVGGQGDLSSSNQFSDGRGNARAEATLDASSGLSMPLMKAEAFVTGGGDSSAFGTAHAVEAYTYNGAAPKTFNLDIMLTGQVFDPTPGDGDTDIVADISIYLAPGYLFGFGRGTLIFELGVVELGREVVSLGAGDTSAIGTLSFMLNPGDSVFLDATLGADAERDLSFADSFSTLTTLFQDPGGLTSVSGGVVVPEPGTFSLVTLGLIGLARAGRRRS